MLLFYSYILIILINIMHLPLHVATAAPLPVRPQLDLAVYSRLCEIRTATGGFISIQDSSKGGAVETGCSGLHYIIGCFAI